MTIGGRSSGGVSGEAFEASSVLRVQQRVSSALAILLSAQDFSPFGLPSRQWTEARCFSCGDKQRDGEHRRAVESSQMTRNRETGHS